MNKFSEKLLKWYDENPRNLPWKKDRDPYSIWISEIIMQQTRVSYGQDYYLRFKEKFPTVFDLARAPQEKVMKLWEGLGYYSRARNLHHTAKYVAFELGGEFPKNAKELIKLKGVGPYTSAAIASFAYNETIVAIDGNAYRVMSRWFGIKNPIDTTNGKKVYSELGQQLIEKVSQRSGDFNQALMNFGATVCKPKSPQCLDCSLNNNCYAYQNDTVSDLPFKSKKMKMKKRFFLFFLWQYKDEVLIEERVQKDVWQNLYQFPMSEYDGTKEWQEILAEKELKEQFFSVQKIETEKQRLTHQLINGQILYLNLNKKGKDLMKGQWVKKKELKNYPFPKLLQNSVKSLT